MSLHDPKFKYRPSFNTDIGRHLRKFRREQRRADIARREQSEVNQPEQQNTPAKVTQIARHGRGRRQ